MNSGYPLQEKCRDYLSSRSSNYEFRCIRFRAVAERLAGMGLGVSDSIMDLGAGRQDFQKFLRDEFDWRGAYVPIDGSIDGTDLETFTPKLSADFIVAIEIIEHLYSYKRFIEMIESRCAKGAVVTTPNPLTTDVLGMDYTHVSVVGAECFPPLWNVRETSLFLKERDSLIATFQK